MRIALLPVTTALALALVNAAAAQSAMPGQTPTPQLLPTQTRIPQTAMPDPNQNVVPSDFGIWPASRAPARVPPVYHYYRAPHPPAYPASPGR